MTTFVLVHGAWHGAWCWHRLVPQLVRRGHRVLTPDLPGHGRDHSPAPGLKLEDYASTVLAELNRLREPAVLVGHSLGGMVISRAAELAPERVRLLVYLTAFLPGDGDSLRELADTDTSSLLLQYCRVEQEAMLLHVSHAGIRPALYADCSNEDVALAERALQPEPLGPMAESISLSAARWGSVPRAFIECTADRSVPLSLQRRMAAAHPCGRVVTLPSGHSPFFSMPERLAEVLTELAP